MYIHTYFYIYIYMRLLHILWHKSSLWSVVSGLRSSVRSLHSAWRRACGPWRTGGRKWRSTLSRPAYWASCTSVRRRWPWSGQVPTCSSWRIAPTGSCGARPPHGESQITPTLRARNNSPKSPKTKNFPMPKPKAKQPVLQIHRAPTTATETFDSKDSPLGG